MHLAPLIQDLAIILGLASLVSLFFQKIKQTVVLGYLIAGIIVGPYTPPFSLIIDIPGVHLWAELGVIFLMFNLGIEFSFKKLKNSGLTAMFTGPFEALFMLGLGYAAGKMVGWSSTDSLFLGAILSISSTTIIIKSLEELKLKGERFSELAFAILVIEDLVGILILALLPLMTAQEKLSELSFLWVIFKLPMVILIGCTLGYLTIPKLINYVGKTSNDETLTILSLGLCLSFVVAAVYFHYSSALGAFIMGLILAESQEVHRIEKLLVPLRNVFAAVFFVSIGMLLNPADLITHWVAILLISALTIFGKIISTTFGTRITGQNISTSIRVGFSLAQIGEFSFIIAGLGLSLGVMSSFLYPVAVAVSIVTTFTTPYLIRFSAKVADFTFRKAS